MAQNATYTRRINLFINGKEVKNDVKSIKAEMQKLINAQAKMTIGSREYVQTGRQIQQLNAILRQHRNQLNQTSQSWLSLSSMADKFNKYAGVFAGFAASFAGVVLGAKKAVNIYLELDEKMADVMKTTGLTKDQVKQLSAELGKIDTRTSQQNLLDLARVAGKLGITAQDEIVGFVKASDQIAVSLSEDLGGNVEEAVNQLGKLTDIFKLKDEFGIEQALLKIGSTINSLGAAGTANEGYLVEFAKRVGGIAPMAGVSITQVMGLGATLDELGQTAEVSGTTYAQVIGAMFKDTPKFAKLAGMGVEEFTKLMSKDANEAFIKVLEGAKGTSGGFAEMAQNLDDMGLDGARSTAVLGVLANNIDKLRERQAYANEEFEKGTSLTDEFNTKNETAQAKLEKAQKEVTALAAALGEKLVPYMTYVNVGFGTFLRLMMGIPVFIKQNSTLLMMLAGAVLAYNARLITSTGLKIKDKAVDIAKMAIEKANLVIMSARVIGLKAYIAMTGNATMAQKRFIVQARAMGAAMSANPIGAIIMGLTLLVGALKLYDTYSSGAIAREKEKKAAVEKMAAANNILTGTYDELSNKIQHLNRLSNAEKRDLQQKTDLTIKQAEAELLLMQAKEKDIYKENERLTALQKSWLAIVEFSSKTSIVSLIPGVDKYVENKEAEWKKENGAAAIQPIVDEKKKTEEHIKSLKGLKSELNEVMNAEAIGDSIGTESIENLEEKIGKYQQALKGAKIGGEDYLRIQKKISDVQKLMSSTTPDAVVSGSGRVSTAKTATVDDNSEEKLAEKKKEAEKKLADAILDIRKRLKLSTLSEHEQEKQRVIDNYADLLKTAEEFGLNQQEIEELQAGELAAIDERFDNERLAKKKEVEDQIADLMASDREKAVQEVASHYGKLIQLAEESGISTVELYRMMQEELANIADERFADEADMFGMTEEDWTGLFEKFDLVMQYIGEIGSIWGNMNQITANKEQASFNKYEKNTKKKKELLSSQLESGEISQEQYNAKVTKLDEDLDKRKAEMQLKQAEREKKLKYFQAVTSTAAAIIHMLADPGGVAGVSLSALAAIEGATQIAAIATEPLPEFAVGGYTSGDKIYTGAGGKKYRAGEKGREWIANNDMLNNPYTGPIIAALESVRNGVPPSAAFGAFNSPAFGEMTAIVPEFANGGYTTTSTTSQARSTQQSIDISPLVAGFNAMAEETRQLRQYMSDPKNRQAFINEKTLQRYADETEQRQKIGRIE